MEKVFALGQAEAAKAFTEQLLELHRGQHLRDLSCTCTCCAVLVYGVKYIDLVSLVLHATPRLGTQALDLSHAGYVLRVNMLLLHDNLSRPLDAHYVLQVNCVGLLWCIP